MIRALRIMLESDRAGADSRDDAPVVLDVCSCIPLASGAALAREPEDPSRCRCGCCWRDMPGRGMEAPFVMIAFALTGGGVFGRAKVSVVKRSDRSAVPRLALLCKELRREAGMEPSNEAVGEEVMEARRASEGSSPKTAERKEAAVATAAGLQLFG